MAHVLLPCDLPSWPEVEALLKGLGGCTSGRQVARTMEALLDACATCLDPDESRLPDDRPGVRELGRFLEEGLEEGDHRRALAAALSRLADRALRLRRPATPFNYSLRKEGGEVLLEREFCARLVAHAFFSTFPRRTPTSHPTLCDFRFAPFFAHLHRRSHRKKLKAFFRFFENLEGELEGELRVTRKVMAGSSFPENSGLSSSLPQGDIYSKHCSLHVMGEVLNSSSSKEAKLFFGCPELLSTLCFVEGLEDFETLLVELTDSSHQVVCRFCFSDCPPPPVATLLLQPVQQQQSFSSCRTSFSLEDLTRMGEGLRWQQLDRSSPQRARAKSCDSALREEEYITAGEESEEMSRASSSCGFVLGGSAHERLGDFRRRIRQRTRARLPRRRSRSLGSTSSDMEDICEDPEEGPLRASSSEPNLLAGETSFLRVPALSPAAETALLRHGGWRRPILTSSSGQPKAYSHDGVRPNLPVPFKAGFRRTRDDNSLPMHWQGSSSMASTSSDSCSDA